MVKRFSVSVFPHLDTLLLTECLIFYPELTFIQVWKGLSSPSICMVFPVGGWGRACLPRMYLPPPPPKKICPCAPPAHTHRRKCIQFSQVFCDFRRKFAPPPIHGGGGGRRFLCLENHLRYVHVRPRDGEESVVCMFTRKHECTGERSHDRSG